MQIWTVAQPMGLFGKKWVMHPLIVRLSTLIHWRIKKDFNHGDVVHASERSYEAPILQP
jgi:hypothetical protein